MEFSVPWKERDWLGHAINTSNSDKAVTVGVICLAPSKTMATRILNGFTCADVVTVDDIRNISDTELMANSRGSIGQGAVAVIREIFKPLPCRDWATQTPEGER